MYFTPLSSVSIVDFKQVNVSWKVHWILDFFSTLVTKYFSILKHFARFWNSFLDSEMVFSILKYFSRFQNIFLDFNFFSRFHKFLFDSEMFFWIQNFFSRFWKFFLDYKSNFSRFWKCFLDGGYQPPCEKF